MGNKNSSHASHIPLKFELVNMVRFFVKLVSPSPSIIQLRRKTMKVRYIAAFLFVEQTVFNIFHMEKKDDLGIITRPLTNISTSEYNIQFQIAYSFMQEKVELLVCCYVEYSS